MPHHVQCVWCFLYSTWSCFDSRPEVVLICLLLSWACVVVWDRCLIWTTDLTEQRRACKVRNTPSGIVCEEFLGRSNDHHDCGQHLPVGWKLRWNARRKESHRIQAFSLSLLCLPWDELHSLYTLLATTHWNFRRSEPKSLYYFFFLSPLETITAKSNMSELHVLCSHLRKEADALAVRARTVSKGQWLLSLPQ